MKFKVGDRIRYYKRIPHSIKGKLPFLGKLGFIHRIREHASSGGFCYGIIFDSVEVCKFQFCDRELEKGKPEYFKNEV